MVIKESMLQMTTPEKKRYLVIDTESSVCQDTQLRILISLAYEVLDGSNCQVLCSQYDIVQLPMGSRMDHNSTRIHGISVHESQHKGKPLLRVLSILRETIEQYKPTVIVGHDVVGDAILLINECIRCGLSPDQLFQGALRELLCTKQMTIGECCIPLPRHLTHLYPHDQTPTWSPQVDVNSHRGPDGEDDGPSGSVDDTNGHVWRKHTICCSVIMSRPKGPKEQLWRRMGESPNTTMPWVM
jgi:hypothetical protein